MYSNTDKSKVYSKTLPSLLPIEHVPIEQEHSDLQTQQEDCTSDSKLLNDPMNAIVSLPIIVKNEQVNVPKSCQRHSKYLPGHELIECKSNQVALQAIGYDITLENVSYNVNVKDKENSTFFRKKTKSKALLSNITCSFNKSKMTGLLGSSGAGKSTLMDLVAGRKTGGYEGEILFDGSPRPSNFKKITGYVEQTDVVVTTLTVYENLYYSAELRLPKNEFTKEMKEERIETVIKDLGLTRCRDTLVGDVLNRGISGGELKRLSIGVELLLLPGILFLDEPTSGLDSATTVDVVNILRNLAEKGHTIICTIHQPSAEAFAMFDQLVLLSKGEICYTGDASGGAPYLKSLGFAPLNAEKFGFNPAEFLLSVTGGGTGCGLATTTGPEHCDFAFHWQHSPINIQRKQSIWHKNEIHQIENSRVDDFTNENSFFHSLCVLTERSFVSALRDRQFLSMRILKNVAVAIILLSVYYDVNTSGTNPNINALACVFMVAALWGMNGMGYITGMIQDRPVFYRERQAGCYKVLPHLISKIILEWPFSLVATFLFSVTIYFGCRFYIGFGIVQFLYFWACVFILNEAAAAFAATLAASSPNMEVAVSIAPMILVIQFIFAGFLIVRSALPVYWRYTARYLSFFTYGFAGLAQNSFEGTANQQLLVDYELTEITKWENLAVLGGLVVFWRILNYLALRFCKHYKK
eukprot:Awhi_evm1s13833